VTAVTVSLLGLLAYTKRDVVKSSLKFAKNSKDFEGSKFTKFIKSLLTPSGRSISKMWMEGKKLHERSEYNLSNIEVIRNQANSDKIKADYMISKAKKDW
jgi:hypothetical protein